MAFQEFYVQAGGSFLNSGSTNSDAATYTSTNGNWNSTTGVFTPTDGSTPASTVSAGDYASVYLDAATTAVYISLITNVAAGVNGAITVSAASNSGARPTTSATGRSIKVGGAQKTTTTGNLGPIFTLGAGGTNNIGGLKNGAGSNLVRVNLKNDAIYSVTSNTNVLNSSSLTYQGYTSSPGDGGAAIIDGSGGGSAFNLLNAGSGIDLIDLEFRTNGTSSTNTAVTLAGNNVMRRCSVHASRGSGVLTSGSAVVLIESEFYGNNVANTVSEGGVKMGATSGSIIIRCISHDNAGSNSFGFRLNTSHVIRDSIADSNGGNGIEIFFNTTGPPIGILNCDSYNNGGYGIKGLGSGTLDGTVIIQSCNLIKNGNTGIDMIGGLTNQVVKGSVDNCGYGSGTMANGGAGATANLSNMQIDFGTGAATTTYTADLNPYVDSANGDFRIASQEAADTGFGFFYQTAPSYTGSLAMPVIGAVQLPGEPVGTGHEVSAGYA